MSDWKQNKITAQATFPIRDLPIYHQSGIYIYERLDEDGITWFYCGQAVDIYNRAVSHAMDYDHLGLSLRKRGYKSDTNPYGWNFRVITFCDKNQLDELEHEHILRNMREGKQSYNVTSGKQGRGKTSFDKTKPLKGYRKGVEYGMYKLSKELQKPLQYVTIAPKDEKKLTIRMYNKFLDLVTPIEKESEEDGEN